MKFSLIFLLLFGATAAAQTEETRHLSLRREDGSMLLLQQTSAGVWQAVPGGSTHSLPGNPTRANPVPFCNPSLNDAASSGSCISVSSVPTLGMLLPMGNISITASGNVGLGNSSPGNRLVVQGVARSLSGGLQFSDGTTLSTATPVGPTGPTGTGGPQGPIGPPGLQGPQGPLSAMPSLNQQSGGMTIAAGGYATVSTNGHTITIGVGPVLCDWAGKKYSFQAKCYINVTHGTCGNAWTATAKDCLSNGTWSTGSVLCQSAPPGPVCGS